MYSHKIGLLKMFSTACMLIIFVVITEHSQDLKSIFESLVLDQKELVKRQQGPKGTCFQT